MKKVCVNRLKADVDKLQYFVNSMEHQEETLEQLFQCILRLFENELSHGGGNPNSVLTQVNATNGLINSQSSIFNSKHNMSELDIVGMSFGKATEDSHQQGLKSLHMLTAATAFPKNQQLLNMNRQYKSDRNVFHAGSNMKGGLYSNLNAKNQGRAAGFSALMGKQQQQQQPKAGGQRNLGLSPLQEMGGEFVLMGDLLQGSQEKKDLKARMTQQELMTVENSSPRFNQSSGSSPIYSKQGGQTASGSKIPNRCSEDLPMVEDPTGQGLWSISPKDDQQAFQSPEQKFNEDEPVQETPSMKIEDRTGFSDNPYHASKPSPFTHTSPSYQAPNFVGAAIQDSHDTLNTSKLLGNLSHMYQTQSVLRGSRQAGSSGQNSGRSFKEVVKVFVQMMVEDIWAYYEGFSWQRKVLLQSEEKKKKRHQVAQPQMVKSPTYQQLGKDRKLLNRKQTLPMGAETDTQWKGLKIGAQCPHESKVTPQHQKGSRKALPDEPQKPNGRPGDTLRRRYNSHCSSSASFTPSQSSEVMLQDSDGSLPQSYFTKQHQMPNYSQTEPAQNQPGSATQKKPQKVATSVTKRKLQVQQLRLDNQSSLSLSKKSSDISNYKMDFIDPSKTGTGRNVKGSNRIGGKGGVAANSPNRLSVDCQRFVDIPAKVVSAGHLQNTTRIKSARLTTSHQSHPKQTLNQIHRNIAWPETTSPQQDRCFIFTEDQLQKDQSDKKSLKSMETVRQQIDQVSIPRGPRFDRSKYDPVLSLDGDARGMRSGVNEINKIHVARLDSGPETKLSLTTNSLVSPADLEPESDITDEPLSGLASPKTVDPVDPHALVLSRKPSKSQQMPAELKSETAKSKAPSQGENLKTSKDGPASSKDMSPQMTRRLLQNVAAIEKDLKLLPTVSQKIGIYGDDVECNIQSTFQQQNRITGLKQSDADSPDFPKRDSSDEELNVKQNVMTGQEFALRCSQESEQYEECQLNYQANPFGTNQSRVYIDDMTSSSGQLSGVSENADCFPVVEQVNLDQKQQMSGGVGTYTAPVSEAPQTPINYNPTKFMQPSSTNQSQELALRNLDNSFSEDHMLPRPHRSSTNHESASIVKEVNEKDYENILTDQTRKQYNADEDQLHTPNRQRRSIKDDRTTERRNSAKKRPQVDARSHINTNVLLEGNLGAEVERWSSHRHMQVTRPAQPAAEPRREQPYSVLLQEKQSTMMICDEAQSQATSGQRTLYETAEQVVNHYQNLNFIPQKNEREDRLELLKQSREFNPVIEFDINSPMSSQHTSQIKQGSSRSNSDLPLMSNSLNTNNSQLVAAAQASTRGVGHVAPFSKACQDATQQQQRQPQAVEPVLSENTTAQNLSSQYSKTNATVSSQSKKSQQPKNLGASLDQQTAQTMHTQHQTRHQNTQNQPSSHAVVNLPMTLLGHNTVDVPPPQLQQHKQHLPPFSPNLQHSKSAQKTHNKQPKTAHSTTSKTTSLSIAIKQHAVNKKMMHADQQLALTKHSKKMQNNSTNLSSHGSERLLSQGSKDASTHAKQQNAASCSPYDAKGANHAHGNSGAQTTGNASANGSALHTPKQTKSGKSYSKQPLALSNTLTQGLTVGNNKTLHQYQTSKKHK